VKSSNRRYRGFAIAECGQGRTVVQS
jgi:hypothetical protein